MHALPETGGRFTWSRQRRVQPQEEGEKAEDTSRQESDARKEEEEG